MTVTADALQKKMEAFRAYCDYDILFNDLDDLCATDEDGVPYLSHFITEDRIEVDLPGEPDYLRCTVGDFIRVCNDTASAKGGTDVTIRSDTYAYQIIEPVSEMAHAIDYHDIAAQVCTKEGVKVSLKRGTLLVGAFACHNKAYHRDYCPPATHYLCVEVDYSEKKVRTEKDDADLIDAYLFDLAASSDAIFRKGDLTSWEMEEPWWAESDFEIYVCQLEVPNEAIKLFLAAMTVQDESLRFFSFYKVLEHFAPIVLNLEVHELLRKKLDSLRTATASGPFIRDVLSIAKGYEKKRDERDLIKGVLLTATDFIECARLLPQSLRKDLAYTSDAKDIDKCAKQVAECLCSTRNQLAHAKATWEARGTEAPASEMEDLNKFVMKAAAQAIRWYNRLPSHQRADVDP